MRTTSSPVPAFPRSPWDWRLYGSILLYFLLPAIYQSYRVFLIGNVVPNPDALAIVSQWQFVQVGFEVIQEALVLPVFFFVGSLLHAQTKELMDRLRTVLFLITVIGLPLILGLALAISHFVPLIGTDPALAVETEQYLSIRIWGILLELLGAGLVALLEALNRSRTLLFLAVLRVLVSLCLDAWLFGGYAFSQHMGVLGVAWSQLGVDAILLFVSLVAVLRYSRTSLSAFLSGDWLHDVGDFLRLGAWSGLESLIRNIAYLVMVLRLLNLIGPGPIAGYYLVMHLFWSFGLIPVLAAAEATKALTGNHAGSRAEVVHILRISLLIGLIVVCAWGLCTPFLTPILGFFQSDPEVISYARSAYSWLFFPYALLCLNFLLDAFLYGAGETRYMAYQAIFTHLAVYLPAFLLYSLGYWQPGFDGVMALICGAVLVDSVLTVIYVRRVLGRMGDDAAGLPEQ